MQIKALLTAMMFFVFQAQAADSVVLKVKRLENRAYHSVMTTTTNNEFNLKAPKETLEQFEASGVKLPITVSQKQTVDHTLKTSKAAKNGDIPFSAVLKTKASVASNAKPEVQNTEKHFEVTGACRGGVLQLDTVKGDGVTPKLEDAVKGALVKVLDTAKYAEKPVKVGDTFSQVVPVTIPMQGSAPVKIILTTRYTMKSIKGNKAYFDIKQEYALDPSSQTSQVKLAGTGSGTMVYDAAEYQVTAMATHSTMDMVVKSGGIESIVKTKTGTDVKITVKPNG
jgi:hypothetical protein